jgi:parallel beta-helix repeat protein
VSGDTIKVCAGTYDETVTVTTPDLTFEGARAGKKGTAAAAASLKKQSIVDDVNGGFILSSTANDTTIDGFAIEGAGSPTVNQDAIVAFAGSSGLTVEDNFIFDNGNGLNMQNPDGSQPALITKNFISNNNSEGNPGTNGQTGTGVFISNGPANSTTISDNRFGSDSQTAINFAGATGDPSTGLDVYGNLSLNDSTFVVATNSTNAVIENNKITVNGTVPGGNGTGILDFGGNTGLNISDNTMVSNAPISAAIALTTYAGAASTSTSTTVSGNKVKGWDYGMFLSSGYSSTTISGNKFSTNGADGIEVQPGADGNVLTHNSVTGDGGSAVDCADQSTGNLTDGTANSWLSNIGRYANSTPAGICP